MVPKNNNFTAKGSTLGIEAATVSITGTKQCEHHQNVQVPVYPENSVNSNFL